MKLVLATLLTLSTSVDSHADVTIKKRGNPSWEPTGAFITSLEVPPDASLTSDENERLFFSEVLGSTHVIREDFEFGYFPVEPHDNLSGDEFRRAVAGAGGLIGNVLLTSDVREPSWMFRGITLVPSHNGPTGQALEGGDVPFIPTDVFPITATYVQETFDDADGRVQFGDFLLLSENFENAVEASAPVPEPAGRSLMMLGLIGLILARRRRDSRRSPTTDLAGIASRSIHSGCYPRNSHAYLLQVSLLLLLVASPSVCFSQITRVNDGPVIPGTEDITPAPSLVLRYWQSDDRNLRYADFSEQDLTGSVFNYVWLRGANFSFSNLTKADFRRSELIDSDLSGADLTNAIFGSVNGAELTGAVITGAGFGIPGPKTMALDRCSSGAWKAVPLDPEQLYSTQSYQEKDLTGIRLHCSDLSGWDLHEQNLTGAFLRGDLSNADLSGANLTDASLLGNLAGADFTDASVVDTKLQDLNSEQLYSTQSHKMKDLRGTSFESSIGDLSGWDFSGQNLAGASFQSASLLGTDFTGANLKNVNFDDADFESALLSSSTVYNQWTTFPVGFAPDAAGLTFDESMVGDFDANNVVDARDYNMLESFLDSEDRWWLYDMFDLTQDGSVDRDDLNVWIADVKGTTPGDADLDGEVAFSDFLILSENFSGPGGWTSGDFDLNGEVHFTDFLMLSENFGNSSPIAAAVPEPSGLGLGWIGLFAMIGYRRFYGHAKSGTLDRKSGAALEDLENRNILTAFWFAPHEVGESLAESAYVTYLHASDMDSDGDTDVFAIIQGDSMAWYENTDGLGTFGQAIHIEHDGGWSNNVERVDLDGNGYLDIVKLEDWGVVWMQNLNGEGFAKEEIVLDISDHYEDPYASFDFGDFDADGDTDILSTVGRDQEAIIAWHENIGSTSNMEFSQQAHFVSRGPQVTAAVEDFDRDGDTDILTRQSFYEPANQMAFTKIWGEEDSAMRASSWTRLLGVRVRLFQ